MSNQMLLVNTHKDQRIVLAPSHFGSALPGLEPRFASALCAAIYFVRDAFCRAAVGMHISNLSTTTNRWATKPFSGSKLFQYWKVDI